jgi:hypothetical protein
MLSNTSISYCNYMDYMVSYKLDKFETIIGLVVRRWATYV